MLTLYYLLTILQTLLTLSFVLVAIRRDHGVRLDASGD